MSTQHKTSQMWKSVRVFLFLVVYMSEHTMGGFLLDPTNSSVFDNIPDHDYSEMFFFNDETNTSPIMHDTTAKNATNVTSPAYNSSTRDFCESNLEWELYLKMFCVPFFTLMGLIGNTLSFLVMFSPLYHRKSYSYYLRALALSDNLMLIITCVLVANEATFDLTGRRLLDNHNSFTCKLSEYLRNVIALVSSWLIVCFTIDRYIAVCHPLQRARLCTESSARISILIVVLVAMASQVYVFVLMDYVEGRNKHQLCHAPPEVRVKYFQVDYYWFSFSLRFMAPFLVVAVCNGLIIFHINRTRFRRGPFEYDKRCRSSNMAICTLYVVCAVFVATLFPNAIISTILITEFIIFKDSVLYCKLLVFNTPFQMVRLINYSFNFVLYGLSGRQFRKEAGKLIRCRMRVSMRGTGRGQEMAFQKGSAEGYRSPFLKHCLEKKMNVKDFAMRTFKVK